jgi:hypothetical protein
MPNFRHGCGGICWLETVAQETHLGTGWISITCEMRRPYDRTTVRPANGFVA